MCLFLCNSYSPLTPSLLSFSCRGALPACRPAEGVGLATWAEEPAAAGPDRLPPAKGWDWKRVLPLLGKTCRKVHFQNQKVKVILPFLIRHIILTSSSFADAVVKQSWLYLTKYLSLPFFSLHILRKEPSSHSVAQVWLALLSQTRQESRDHNELSESCSYFLIQPLTHCLEYTQRLAKKVLRQAPTQKPQT